MTVERIRELLEVQPFRPFVLHLADVQLKVGGNGSAAKRRRG